GAGEIFSRAGIRLFFQTLCRLLIIRSNPRHDGLGWREERILHAKRIEYALFQELIERLPRNNLDDAAEGIESCTRTVGPTRTRLEFERYRSEARNVIRQSFIRLARNLRGFRCADGSAY